MKTVIIWDELNAAVTFFVVDGDHTALNNVYINSTDATNEQLDGLNALIYKDDDGEFKHEALDEFPKQAVIEGANVIVAGFLP